jgi:hypothetical protein
MNEIVILSIARCLQKFPIILWFEDYNLFLSIGPAFSLPPPDACQETSSHASIAVHLCRITSWQVCPEGDTLSKLHSSLDRRQMKHRRIPVRNLRQLCKSQQLDSLLPRYRFQDEHRLGHDRRSSRLNSHLHSTLPMGLYKWVLW